MRFAAYGLLLFVGVCASSYSIAEEVSLTVSFTHDEVQLLQDTLKKDKLIASLVNEQKGLSALNTLMSFTAPGPLALTFKWNKALFRGWAIANGNIAKIGKLKICSDLLEPILDDSPNTKFFEDLRTIRGCDDL